MSFKRIFSFLIMEIYLKVDIFHKQLIPNSDILFRFKIASISVYFYNDVNSPFVLTNMVIPYNFNIYFFRLITALCGFLSFYETPITSQDSHLYLSYNAFLRLQYNPSALYERC